ncbi:MAG: SH3 domain-containing protein [Prochlorococcaceae cyanobacterium]|jgi:hypothetical protein
MDWRLIWLLGFALIAPAALPAGGAERRSPELRRRQGQEPWLVDGLSATDLALRCSPHHQAPCLIHLEQGEPLRLLRTWSEPGGRRWLQVQAQTSLQGAGPCRGWLPG